MKKEKIIDFVKNEINRKSDNKSKQIQLLLSKIKKDETLFIPILELTGFLSLDCKLSQRIWHIYNEIYEIPKCLFCNNEVKFIKLSRGYKNVCSDECKHQEWKQVQKDFLNNMTDKKRKKYFDKIQQNMKKTCIEKYGVEFSSQSKERKINYKITCNKKFGGNSPLANKVIREKMIKTTLDRYDVEYASQSKEFRKKCENTCNKKYGFPSHLSNPEIQEKIFNKQYKTKTYICPNGKIIKTQGYGIKFLDYLFKNNIIDENNIFSEFEAGLYQYENNKTYRPDFKIILNNIEFICEIKSTYTLDYDFETNLKKINFMIENDKNIIVIIYGKKKIEKYVFYDGNIQYKNMIKCIFNEFQLIDDLSIKKAEN
jgi:hypothetical protein